MIQTLLEELQLKLKITKQGTPRDIQFPNLKNKINVAIGMRRTGKTYLLFQQMNTLIENGIDLSQILYLNFEDDRLLPMDQSKLADIIDTFYTLFPANHEQCVYLFLDEIQNVKHWPNIVRRLFDTKNIQMYLSGSSAKLLSREISTSLRGRSLSVEVYPYSFNEYAKSNNLEITNTLIKGKKFFDTNKDQIKTFLLKGGFPEVQYEDIAARMQKRILQDYVKGVVFRDIVERHNISNLPLVQYMIKQLLKNISCTLSIHKLYADLKSQGLKVSKNTLYEYLDYIEDAYLAFSVPLYSESIRKIHSNPKKIYAIDTGLVAAYSFNSEENLGHLFENLIFLDLKRHGLDIYYYLTEERFEVDFYIKNISGDRYLFQVCWDMENSDTKAREERALKHAIKETGHEGMVITPDNYFEFLEKVKNLSQM